MKYEHKEQIGTIVLNHMPDDMPAVKVRKVAEVLYIQIEQWLDALREELKEEVKTEIGIEAAAERLRGKG